jgi:ketosteroid isomerase-like protein
VSLRNRKVSSVGHRTFMPIVMACAASLLILAPGAPGAGAGTGHNTDDEAQIVSDAKRVEIAVVDAYNARKWDELRPLFAEDVLLLAPNHEPVRGRDAILEYYKMSRDSFGEINDGWKFLRVTGGGTFASLAGEITIGSGRIRLWYTDLYERQPDGSLQLTVNAFAFPERAVG